MNTVAQEPRFRSQFPLRESAHWSLRRIVGALAAGTLFGLLLVGLIFAVIFFLNIRLPVSAQITLSTATLYSAIFVSVWFFLIRGHRASWGDIGFLPVSLGTLLKMLALVPLLLVLNGLMVGLIGLLLGEPIENPQERVIAPGGVLTLTDYLWLLPAVSVAAPLVEEIVFRGVLFPYLRRRMGVLYAVLLSAALFSVVHFIPILLVPFFVTGVILAVVVERYKSIIPSILLHALLNGISLTVFYLGLSSSL